MEVDSFKYVSRLIARYYQMSSVKIECPIPWTQLQKRLEEARFSLVTSGGLYDRRREPPFDLERECAEPTWGDPTYRTIPSDIEQRQLGISHHHINGSGALADINVLLPVTRFHELAEEGAIGSLAPHVYSFMGYQGFPADLSSWRDLYAPEVAKRMLAEGVDCVLLTTA